MQPCPQGAYNLIASQKSNKVKKKLNSISQGGTHVYPIQINKGSKCDILIHGGTQQHCL